MKRWFYLLTGGRPMKRDRTLFWDWIGSQSVGLYVDGLGRKWMACGPWAWFRVKYQPEKGPANAK